VEKEIFTVTEKGAKEKNARGGILIFLCRIYRPRQRKKKKKKPKRVGSLKK